MNTPLLLVHYLDFFPWESLIRVCSELSSEEINLSYLSLSEAFPEQGACSSALVSIETSRKDPT